ncbi:MAG: SUF system Fe-S cluster assembly protein [Phycisphaeraceae bacterium]
MGESNDKQDAQRSQLSVGHTERAAQDSEDPRGRSEREQAEREAQAEDAIASAGSTEEKIIAALKQVYDPEIPVDIYELGLIYDIDIDESKKVHVRMTLTSPACPVAEQLPGEVRAAVERVPEVTGAEIELTFEPPWSMEMMSEEAKLMLGFM